eukprot:gene8558-20145_t
MPPDTFVEKVKALITARTQTADGAKFAILLAGGNPKAKAGATKTLTDEQLLENQNRSTFETEFAEYLWKIKDTNAFHHSSEGRVRAVNFKSLANKMFFHIMHNPGGGFQAECQKDEKNRDVYKFTWSGSESGSAFDAIMESLDKIEMYFGLMDLATSGFNPNVGGGDADYTTLTQLLYMNARIAARKVTDLYMEDKVQFEPFVFGSKELTDELTYHERNIADHQALDEWLFGLVRHFGDCCKLRSMHTTMTVENLGTLTTQQLIDMEFLLDVPLLTFKEAEQIVEVEHDRKIVHTLSRIPEVKIPAIDIDRMATKIEAAKDDWNAVCKLLKPLICWLFDFVVHVCSQLYASYLVRFGTQSSNDARINYGLKASSYGRVAFKHSAVKAAPDKFPELPLKHSGESWFNLAMHGTHYVDALHLEFSEEQPSKKPRLAASFFDRGIINIC